MDFVLVISYLRYTFSLALCSLLPLMLLYFPIIFYITFLLLYHNFNIITKQKGRIFNKYYEISYILSCCKITPLTIVQPDILIVCDKNKLDGKRCNVAPDFIIEIVSPNNASDDYIRKLYYYKNKSKILLLQQYNDKFQEEHFISQKL